MFNMNSILVPVSFAPSNEKAMEIAARIATSFKAKIYVLNVYKTLPRFFYSVGGSLFTKSMEQERAENIKRLNEFIKREMKRLKLSLEVEELEIEDKKPVEAILNVANKKKIDLIVLGHHEESKLERFLFGRNIKSIIDNAPCDVIVTKTYLYAKKARELSAA